MWKWIRRIWISAGLAFVVFLVWNTQAHRVDPAVFRSTNAVRVVDNGALMQFLPAQTSRGAGFIFLPGGNAQPGQRWVVGGHSRGAALAATYAWEHSGQVAGLVLIGTTHPRELDLSNSGLPMAKIYGTRDCVADTATMLANSYRLPLDIRWFRIEGGNHRQFGYYGYQLGDCSATISRAAQHALTARALKAFLKEQ